MFCGLTEQPPKDPREKSLRCAAVPRQLGSALGNHTAKQLSKAVTSSNVLDTISNKAYSLSGIINLGPTHTS